MGGRSDEARTSHTQTLEMGRGPAIGTGLADFGTFVGIRCWREGQYRCVRACVACAGDVCAIERSLQYRGRGCALCCFGARQVGWMRHVIGSTADKRRSHPRRRAHPHPTTQTQDTDTHMRTRMRTPLLSLNDRRGLNEKAGMSYAAAYIHTAHLIKVPRTPRSAGGWQVVDG